MDGVASLTRSEVGYVDCIRRSDGGDDDEDREMLEIR